MLCERRDLAGPHCAQRCFGRGGLLGFLGVRLLCYRPVSVVRGGSWIFRLSDTNSSVPAVARLFGRARADEG